MRSSSLHHSGLVVDDEASSSTFNLMGTLLVILKWISLSAEVGGGLGGGVSSPAMVAEFFGEPKFLNKMFPKRSEGEESEYPFFEGDGSSSDEWGYYGVAGEDYEGPPVFDDD
ncbi:hypothetical protein Tco_0005300 [Tanacetum coccineum]